MNELRIFERKIIGNMSARLENHSTMIYKTVQMVRVRYQFNCNNNNNNNNCKSEPPREIDEQNNNVSMCCDSRVYRYTYLKKVRNIKVVILL